MISFFSDKYPEVVESYDSPIFTFLRNQRRISHNGSTNLHSYQQGWRVPFSPHSHWHLLSLAFLIVVILTGMRCFLIVVLVSISLMISDAKHLPVSHLYVFIGRLSVQNLCLLLEILLLGECRAQRHNQGSFSKQQKWGPFMLRLCAYAWRGLSKGEFSIEFGQRLTESKVWKWKSLSRVWFFKTPWTIQSMEFSRPEYWSGWPIVSPVDLPNPGVKLGSPALQVDSLPIALSGKP